jgi:hypothetical protein
MDANRYILYIVTCDLTTVFFMILTLFCTTVKNINIISLIIVIVNASSLFKDPVCLLKIRQNFKFSNHTCSVEPGYMAKARNGPRCLKMMMII